NPLNNVVTVTTIVENPSLPTDLALTVSGPILGTEGSNLQYDVTIMNNGPADGHNVVVSDPLPSNLSFVSTTFPQGTVTVSNGVLTISIPTVVNLASVSGAITLLGGEEGTIASVFSLTADNPDTNPSNDSQTVSTDLSDPAVVPTGQNLTPSE